MIDFEIPEETKIIRAKVRKFVHEVCIPAEKDLRVDNFEEILADLRQQARAEGLWCPFFPDRMGRHGIEAASQCFGANGAGRSDFGRIGAQHPGTG